MGGVFVRRMRSLDSRVVVSSGMSSRVLDVFGSREYVVSLRGIISSSKIELSGIGGSGGEESL